MTRLRKKLENLAIAIKTRNINDAHKYAKNTILILAGIGISVLTQTGLFDKAKQAKEITDNKYEEENMTLAEYNNKINEVFNTRENNSNNSYTEEEQVVGSWKDGKKIYRRVVEFEKTQSGTQDTGVIINDLDTIITTYGVVIQNETKSQVPVPYHTSTSDYAIFYFTTDGILRCNANGYSANAKYNLVIEYTKK